MAKPTAPALDAHPLVNLPPAPRPRRDNSHPAPRLNTHKRRAQWFRARTAWPLREAPTHAMIYARGHAEKTLAPAPGEAQWELAGPTNVGGRMTCAVTHPSHPERIWAGAAAGGVWYSPDAGQVWQPLWHKEDVLNIGALAIDRTNPQVLYAGTGEANLSSDSYPGVGLYRTLDSGQTWHLLASSLRTGLPSRIGVIAIDPFNPQHLRVGGIGLVEVSSLPNDVGGMYTSRDGGVTWQRETFITSRNYWCHSIVFDPKTPGILYATSAQGARSGIYRSDDGGATWRQLTKACRRRNAFIARRWRVRRIRKRFSARRQREQRSGGHRAGRLFAARIAATNGRTSRAASCPQKNR
ncbi:MAG: hypothetical protein U0Y68_08805 [Blastocatellia bacterium]